MGDVPSLYSEQGYVAAQLIGATAESLKGELGDISRVSQELKKVAPRIETPSGPLGFDKYNQRIAVVYILKVEKRGGKLTNVAIDRIPNIAQEDVWKWWNK
jgi:branched-chain amino acid transport system substrate-binding protein